GVARFTWRRRRRSSPPRAHTAAQQCAVTSSWTGRASSETCSSERSTCASPSTSRRTCIPRSNVSRCVCSVVIGVPSIGGGVLLVGDRHVPDGGAERDGGVGEEAVGGGPVPMAFAGRDPDPVAGADGLGGQPARADESVAGLHEQDLAAFVLVPVGARAGFEGDGV